ncbi:MAG: MFS transporter [Opitutales bacterium]
MKTKKLTVLEKVGFGSGDTAVNVVISAFFLIINFFYTDIFGLKPVHLGMLFLVANIVDAVTDPLMGMLTDRVDTRWGRYRPYFLFLSVPFGITILLAFSTPDFDYNGKLIWAYATHLLLKVAFTAVTIPYISLVSVLTEDPKERLSANGYRLFLAKVGALLVTSAVPVLAVKFGGEDRALGYQMAMGLMAILAVILFLFCFFTTTERVRHVVEKKSFAEQVTLLLKNDQWLILCGVCFIGTVGYVIRSSVALYYVTYNLGGDAVQQSIFITTSMIATIVAMTASTWITKGYDKIKLFRYSQLAVPVIALVMFFAVGSEQFIWACIVYAVLSFVIDLHAPVFWSAIAEAVDYGEAKEGKRVAGLSFGGISFFQKLGIGVAGMIVNGLLVLIGYEANVAQTTTSLVGLALMLSLIPSLFHAAMGGLMFLYKINDDYYERMKRGEIEGLKPVAGLMHSDHVPPGTEAPLS